MIPTQTAILETPPGLGLTARAFVPPERHPTALYLARLRPGSRRAQLGALGWMARAFGGADAATFPWWSLEYAHVAFLRARLADSFSLSTGNRHLCALRGVLEEAWKAGLMATESYHRAVAVKGFKVTTLPTGRDLSGGELAVLFRACADGTVGGTRDAALLAVLFAGGLRRAEAVALKVADVNHETGELRVDGKGDKQRLTYLPAGGRAAVAAWLAIRGGADGPLLCPVNKAGRVELRHMTPQAVLGVVRKRAADAGVAPFTPHDLRRTFVSTLLDAGADISTVQRLAGHASVTTTTRYDRRGERAKQKAVDLLHVPYAGLSATGLG